eukprot:7389877-Prymnesium_polylepis.1
MTLQIRTRSAGAAVVVIEEQSAAGNRSVSQPMHVEPADIDPGLTTFECGPSPAVAGALLLCAVTTRGVYGNAAGGAAATDFVVSGVDALGQQMLAVPDGQLIA